MVGRPTGDRVVGGGVGALKQVQVDAAVSSSLFIPGLIERHWHTLLDPQTVVPIQFVGSHK